MLMCTVHCFTYKGNKNGKETVSRYLTGVGFFLDYLTTISASPVVNKLSNMKVSTTEQEGSQSGLL
jgi:hypothetical protein